MSPELIGELTGLFGVLIPILAVVLGIGLAAWSIYLEHQRKRLQYQERQLMIEKGMVPPPMLVDEEKHRSPDDRLRRGVVLVFLGAGLAGAGLILRGTVEEELGGMLGAAAAIVAFIGAGNLVYYAIARRTAKNADIAPLP